MDVQTLANAMGNRAGVNYATWVDGINRAMILGGITNVNRAAMFLAQCGAESGGLQWMTELADGSEYNGRTDLGNIYPGDGPRYKGRGPIQITGRSNYTRVSQWAFSKKLVPSVDYFVQHPEQLAQPQFVWLGPIWYWTIARSNLNALSDAKDIEGATRAINGGLNGIDGRTQRWRHCLALGSAILPDNNESPSSGKDWFDMASLLELQGEVQRGLASMVRGTANAHVTAAQAKDLHDSMMRLIATTPVPARYVTFAGSKNPGALFVVLGGNVAWMTPHSWGVQVKANLGVVPHVEPLDTSSPEYLLPILPGTADPRK